MKHKEKLYSATLIFISLIYFVTLVSSTALADNEQNISGITPRAFVANGEGISTVSEIDTAQDKFIDNIRVVGDRPSGVAVAETKTASKVYVVATDSQCISEFNTVNPHNVNVVNDTYISDSESKLTGEIVASPDGKKVYLLGYNRQENVVFVLDTEKDNFIDAIHLGFYGGDRIAVAETRMGTKLYVTRLNDYVSVIDIKNKTIKELPGFYISTGIAAASDGKKVYALNDTGMGTGYVLAIDTATDKILPNPIYISDSPKEIAISPNGDRAYVLTDRFRNALTVIDITKNIPIATVDVGVTPQRIAVNPDGKKVYVTNTGLQEHGLSKGTVSVIDAVRNAPIKEITVGLAPTGIAISRRGGI